MLKIIPTAGILNGKQAQSLLSKLMYSLEGISDCRLDSQTQDILIEVTDSREELEIGQTVSRLMEKERNNRMIGTRMYVQSEDQEVRRLGGKEEVQALFAADGSAKRGLAVSLMQQMDKLLLDMSVRNRAQMRQYPSMIPLHTLKKCNYIPTFPQNIHLVSELPHRLQELEKVRETEHLEEVARLSPYALSPAVCFHCYAELSGTRLYDPLLLTARGTCYRHEAVWRLGNHRLNEFSMRETVIFGDAAFIEDKRKLFMNTVWELFGTLGLKGKVETATDPFYFSEENGKGQHQMMGNMKYELIVDAGEEAGSFSIASFNNMGNSLSKPFEVMDQEWNPVHSGCVAFGIDRWVYALLIYHGTDLSLWPSAAKRLLELE